jgi:hypothetical protein
MSAPTKELIFPNEVIAEMIAGGWKRGNPEEHDRTVALDPADGVGSRQPDGAGVGVWGERTAPVIRAAHAAPPAFCARGQPVPRGSDVARGSRPVGAEMWPGAPDP